MFSGVCADRLTQRDQQLTQLVDFLHDNDPSGRLRHYSGHDVTHILRLLTDHPHPAAVTSSGHPRESRDFGIPSPPPATSGDYDVREIPPTTAPSLDVFRRAARCLHYVSIAILSVLLLEVEFCPVSYYYAPAPMVGALSDDARLTSDDVYLSRTSGLSREQRGRPRKTKIGA